MHRLTRVTACRNNFSAMDSLSGILKNPFKSKPKKQASLKVLR